jgi:hypothetical protein
MPLGINLLPLSSLALPRSPAAPSVAPPPAAIHPPPAVSSAWSLHRSNLRTPWDRQRQTARSLPVAVHVLSQEGLHAVRRLPVTLRRGRMPLDQADATRTSTSPSCTSAAAHRHPLVARTPPAMRARVVCRPSPSIRLCCRWMQGRLQEFARDVRQGKQRTQGISLTWRCSCARVPSRRRFLAGALVSEQGDERRRTDDRSAHRSFFCHGGTFVPVEFVLLGTRPCIKFSFIPSLQHHSVSRSIISRGCSLKYLKGCHSSDDYAAAMIGVSSFVSYQASSASHRHSSSIAVVTQEGTKLHHKYIVMAYLSCWSFMFCVQSSLACCLSFSREPPCSCTCSSCCMQTCVILVDRPNNAYL